MVGARGGDLLTSRIDIRERADGRIVARDGDTGIEASAKTKPVALRNLARALEEAHDDAESGTDSYEYLRDELGVDPGEEPPE